MNAFHEEPPTAVLVARHLVTSWEGGGFAASMRKHFGWATSVAPAFDAILVFELEQGDFLHLSFPAGLCRRAWRQDREGFREVVDAGKMNFATEGEFYRVPQLDFEVAGDRVLTRETLGPRLTVRRLFRIARVGDLIQENEPLAVRYSPGHLTAAAPSHKA